MQERSRSCRTGCVLRVPLSPEEEIRGQLPAFGFLIGADRRAHERVHTRRGQGTRPSDDGHRVSSVSPLSREDRRTARTSQKPDVAQLVMA